MKMKFFKNTYAPIYAVCGAVALISYVYLLLIAAYESILALLYFVVLYAIVAVVYHLLFWLADRVDSPDLESDDFNTFFFGC